MSRRDLVIEVAPFAAVAVADQVLLLASFVVPTQELYELALIAMLVTPALVFVLVVIRLGFRSRPMTRDVPSRAAGG